MSTNAHPASFFGKVGSRLGRFAIGSTLVAGLLAPFSSPAAPAAAGGVNLCADGRPCVTELFIDGYSRLQAKWTGNWDHYNVRWENPGLVRDADLDGKSDSITVLESAWNRNYHFAVQGCNYTGIFGLGGSKCTAWASADIHLGAPSTPDNARLDGNEARWGATDPQTFWVRVRGVQKSDGKEVFVDTRAPSAKRMGLPDGWRDRFKTLKLCAANPGGQNCTVIYNLASPATSPNPNAKQLPAKPAAPASFTATRDGGFGSRIILGWRDVADEEYYYLTAFSAQTKQPLGFPLPAPAPKLGANSTTFIITGDAAAVVGGLEFHLQACNAGGCSSAVIATID